MIQDSRLVEEAWSRDAEAVLAALGVGAAQGLAAGEVQRRLRRFGPNRLKRYKPKSAWRILADQLTSLMMALLAAVALVAFTLGHLVDGAAIVTVIVLNATIGFLMELRGVRSMEALHRLVQVSARVRRDGREQKIPADGLVPGDIVVLEGGDVVSADLRVIAAANLQADESTLTGESAPVAKDIEPVAENSALAERHSMLHSGTAITGGSGEGVVVATGATTELGRIAALAAETKGEITPLERRLAVLGRRLIWVALALTALLAGSGILLGRDPLLMLETAIALAVAAVPEGLPVVAGIALARGMWRMARQNVLISRLSAVETLGATGVICTDKTGTLTENRMSVARLLLASGEDVEVGTDRAGAWRSRGAPVDPAGHGPLRLALETVVLCNNAGLSGEGEGGIGDPLEVALLAAGRKAGLDREELRRKQPEVREEAFSTDTRMMATFHTAATGFRVAVKGSPESVLAACSHWRNDAGSEALSAAQRDHWLGESTRLAEKGLRVLALATRHAATADAPPYADLEFLGLVGLLDPPRQDVRAAIEECQAAGIRVVMVTGDQPATACYVAEAVGLVDGGVARVVHGREMPAPQDMTEDRRRELLAAHVFARVDPAQKLDIIALHQGSGEVVAMTGDGVNDAPALKKADIGVAMGKRGTQVAREAADMVLKDDAFNSIVVAVRHGRIIFDNIRKFVLYLMSCNVSEVMVVALATLAGAPLPLLPLQILYLNLITDIFPALALGMGRGDARTMARPPRPASEPVLTAAHWWAIAGYGSVITAAVLGAFALALQWLELPPEQAVTVSFLALAFAHLWHVFNMRSTGSSLLSNDISRNPYVWGAILLCSGLFLLAVYLPGLAAVLVLQSPGSAGWTLALAASAIPLLVGQSIKVFAKAKAASSSVSR